MDEREQNDAGYRPQTFCASENESRVTFSRGRQFATSPASPALIEVMLLPPLRVGIFHWKASGYSQRPMLPPVGAGQNAPPAARLPSAPSPEAGFAPPGPPPAS